VSVLTMLVGANFLWSQWIVWTIVGWC